MLKNKVAVITGASRGIGKTIALEFAQAGADIALVYIGDEALVQEALEQIRAVGVKAQAYECNVANFEDTKIACDKITADFGKVDILVNNAGITRDNLMLRMGEEDFDAVIDVNLKGAFNFIRHLSRSIMKSDAGRIINISSVSGLMGNAGQANYSASKAGLIGLTKTIAKELSSRKVTCNAIAPGFIETNMTDVLPEAVKEAATAVIPLKRMGTAQEVANVALFLASDMSSYVTGEVIRVDGGMCM